MTALTIAANIRTRPAATDFQISPVMRTIIGLTCVTLTFMCVVAIGRAVTYRDESTGQEKTVAPVFPEDADIARGRISILTPIGVALIGLAEGASLHWDTRDGKRRVLTVLHVTPKDVSEGLEVQ